MTALQQHDSLDPHPALDWPIEITEFAHFGDAVAYEFDRSREIEGPPCPEQHWGTYVWTVGENAVPWTLAGTTEPGWIVFDLPDLTDWTQEGRGKFDGDWMFRPPDDNTPDWAHFFADDPQPEQEEDRDA